MNQFLKRTIDIVGASLGLIFIAPFTPFIILAIKKDGGPAVIKLDRVSHGKIIKVYKFRSMINNAHLLKKQYKHLNQRSDGPFFKIKDDPRITRAGKVLRKFRLDEFPQLINVFKGELSLVGPRPHEPEEVIFYPVKFKSLLLEKSGVTGLSQTSGASGLPFLKELEIDNYYIKNQSFKMDIKIIIKTMMIIFFDPSAV